MARLEALITSSVLRWCRETAGFEIRVAAQKIGRPEQDILAWEDGSLRPTVAQARKAAKVYKRPFAVLYMDSPPEGFSILRDYRRLPDSMERNWTPASLELFRLTNLRQQWLHDYLSESGSIAGRPIPKHDLSESSDAIAKSIRSALRVTIDAQTRAANRSQSYALWQKAAEDIGVYVFKSVGDTEEFRGFAMADDLAPVVVINSADALVAQTFTLIHELVHLSIDAPGVSNLESRGRYKLAADARVEWLCNRVAAECLLPPKVVDQVICENLARVAEAELVAQQISRRFKVSEETVARRMLDISAISHDEYRELRDQYRRRWLEMRKKNKIRQKEKGGGPGYYITAASHYSTSFARSVISAYVGDRITGRDASALLNAKVGNFSGIAKQIGLKEMVSL